MRFLVILVMADFKTSDVFYSALLTKLFFMLPTKRCFSKNLRKNLKI